MLTKANLEKLYERKCMSMQEIAKTSHCSVNRVQYWMKKHGIVRRSISDALYCMHNPKGDPFCFDPPATQEEMLLYGLGIGLYWGEGTKSNIFEVRLGNTDPALILMFIAFLQRFFRVKKSDMRFGLQIFSDIDPKEALDFWRKKLKVHTSQFYKIIVTRSGSIGTYRHKNRTGVLTLHYHNKKLRNLLIYLLSNLAGTKAITGICSAIHSPP